MQWGVGLIPGQGAKIPHSLPPKKQNIALNQCCNKFNKDFKNDPHKKKILKKKKKRKLRLPACDPLVLKIKVNYKSMTVEIVLYSLQ